MFCSVSLKKAPYEEILMNISFGLASLFQGEPLSAAAGIVYIRRLRRERGGILIIVKSSPPQSWSYLGCVPLSVNAIFFSLSLSTLAWTKVPLIE